MFLRAVYSIAIFFAALFYFPYFLYLCLVHKKYRKSWKERLGIGLPQFENLTQPVIWVHAVSFGETKAIIPLVKKIKQDHPESTIIFSTITETGLDEAKKNCPQASYHLFLPFDFAFLVRPLVRKVKPQLVLLCETDFWFHFLDEAKKQGAKIVLVNGKISEKSLKAFKSISFFTKALFQRLDLAILQGELYKERFNQLPIEPEKLQIGGNIKLDGEFPLLSEQEKAEWISKWQLHSPVIVIGSSHNPEEKLILDALRPIWEKKPDLKVILVPRHLDRLHEVEDVLQKADIPFTRFSAPSPGPAKVLLLDAMGQLKKCYQFATIALVAGSWTEKVGGHNVLEPSAYGKPVIYGPYMHTQRDFDLLVKEYQAGFQVPIENLTATLERLLSNPTESHQIGSRGLVLMQECKGALNRTYALIHPFLTKPL